MLARVDADPEIQRETAIILPRMGFEMIGMNYDGSRKLITVGRTVKKDDTNANKLKRQYNPVPWNFNFNLYVYVKNAEDGTKIIEQILPFFTPEWTATVNLIPEMNVVMDIPIILNSVDPEDTYEGQFEDTRKIIWTLSFTVKGWLYGPIVSKPIVKISKQQFYVPVGMTAAEGVGNSEVIGTLTVTPGLLANGSPTTNAAASVNTNIIEIDDDYGYAVVTDGNGVLFNG